MDKKNDCGQEPIEFGLKVKICDNVELMGATAATKAAKILKKYTVDKKKQVVCVFAAAPSQNTFLANLFKNEGIDWTKVTAFHLDEYLDLPRNHPNTFEVYLRKHIFEKIGIPESNINYIKEHTGSAEEIVANYEKKLSETIKKIRDDGGVYIAFIGIGVNGHIAFNEPGTDIYSSKWVLPIEIDDVSVQQQYDDYKNHPDPASRYATLADVPRKAITMSCAAILEADYILTIVPGEQKADAIQKAVEGPITPLMPASLLRQHHSTVLYVDKDAASKLNPAPAVEK